MPIKGGYLLLAGGGAIVAWSGLRGKSWSTVLQTLIKGGNPKNVAVTNPITGNVSGGTAGSGSGPNPTGSSGLAQTAATIAPRYHYVFGGVPDNGEVDCSSYLNEAATLTGLPIPPFPPFQDGHLHGPTTVQWRVTRKCVTIPRNQSQSGDIVVWLTHVGIVTDNGQNMWSALNPTLGIQHTPIDGYGPRFEPMIFRRFI